MTSVKNRELCMKAMNGLKSTGLITMDEACCIESTEAGRLMSIYYIDLETMKHIMKIEGNETLERLLYIVCESHELADMHLRVDERRCLNALNRNSTATTIRFPMKGKITTRQMKVNCIIQAVLGCLPISDPSLNQETMKVMRVADRVCKCLVAYVTRADLISQEPKFFSAVLNSLILAKCISAQLWENSQFLSRQLKGIGPTISALLASAGKVNFLMLKESHPRDLERIMNKGPPAGNILLKQVCLLPKYIMTATAIDEKTVKIQLVLQNQSYLAENLDHLTASDTHKFYVVVGDSENHVLLLTYIKDKKMINMHVGTISYKITRKHDFEHKVYAYCISSNFVGIDDECEYTFQDLHPTFSHPHEDINTKTIQKKQSLITDNFNERKRKMLKNITETKEKKRRESPIIEKFNCLKESLCVPLKPLTEDLTNTMDMINKIKHDNLNCYQEIYIPVTTNSTKTVDDKDNNLATQTFAEGNEPDQFDHKINSLLNEIESEISRNQKDSTTGDVSGQNFTINSHPNFSKGKTKHQNILAADSKDKYPGNMSLFKKQLVVDKQKRQKVTRNQNKSNLKSNYSFIDLLERNVNYSDDEEKYSCNNDIGFSKAIKPGIDNYLMQTKSNSSDFNSIINKIIETSCDAEISKTAQNLNNNIDKTYILNKALDIKNNINNKVVTQVCNEDDKIDNTNYHRENEAITLKNITSHINLQRNSCHEETHNMVKPYNTLDISNNIKDSNDNNNNKTLCLTQGFSQTDTTLENSDDTYKKYAGITSPFCVVRTGDEVKCKDLAFSNKYITSVNCIEKSAHQFDELAKKIKNIPIEHKKQYTCKSTKIDICTNQSDQIIHVVRKLNMNVNITEAVYFANHCDRKPDNLTKKKLITQGTFASIYKPIAIKNKLRNMSDPFSLSNVKVLPIEETNKTKDYKLNVFDIPHNLHDLSKPIKYASICNKDQNLSEKELGPSLNIIKTNFKLGVTNNYNRPVENKESQNDLKVIDLEKIQQNNLCTIKNSQTLSDNDMISDILEKYKKLFQDKQNEQDFVTENLNKVIDSKNKTIELKKNKRPFNILDIDNIRVSFPNILIDVSPAKTIPLSALHVKDKNYNEEVRDIEDQTLMATPISHEAVPDLQIDQSMFDPKTLLVCLGNDNNNNEIIPPPLEYRDKTNDNTPEDIHMFTSDFIEDIQNVHNISQYQTQHILDSDQTSAASENMEYWMLSRENSKEYYNSYYTNLPNQVKYPENKNWMNHNNSISECTLDQFKFKHKEKFSYNS